MTAVIVIAHGPFGVELVRTAQDIIGRQEALFGLSVTAEMGVDSLARAIEELIAAQPSSQGFLFLVDMLGGTPCNTVLLKTKNVPAEVVTGVNLYMVLSALRNRAEMGLKELAAKAAEDGRRAIVLPREILMKKLR
jgi:mannose PTS system EIIA component